MLGLTLDRVGRDRGLRVLALGAHADDIEIGCGGTMLDLVGRGRVAAATWVVFSGSPERADPQILATFKARIQPELERRLTLIKTSAPPRQE